MSRMLEIKLLLLLLKLANGSCDINNIRIVLIKLSLEYHLEQLVIKKSIVSSNMYAMHTVGNVPSVDSPSVKNHPCQTSPAFSQPP